MTSPCSKIAQHQNSLSILKAQVSMRLILHEKLKNPNQTSPANFSLSNPAHDRNSKFVGLFLEKLFF
jgi:hypothetical protein